MNPIKVMLCPACGACPAVELTDEGAAIGEENNVVRLTPAEWNELVARVRSGELRDLGVWHRLGRRPWHSRRCRQPRRTGDPYPLRPDLGAEQIALRQTGVAPPMTEQPAEEIAIDALHHFAYAKGTGAAYNELFSPEDDHTQ